MDASASTGNAQRAARQLGDLLAAVEITNDWSEIETNAQVLANELRVRGGPVDEHTLLGRTLLPQTLTSLIKKSLEGTRIPEGERSAAVFELLRVGANLCMDHNENRGQLLEAGYPQVVLSLLEAFCELIPARASREPLPLTISQLKLVKTAIGAVLNISLGYEPVQTRLISLEAPLTLLKLSTAIYPPGAWLHASSSGAPNGSVSEPWGLRKNILEWSWRAIAGFKDNETQPILFGPEALSSLVIPLFAFIPPFPTASGPLYENSQTGSALRGCDVDALEEVCELLESLTMDVEDVRLAFARGLAFPDEQGGQSCLTALLDFIEYGHAPPYWNDALEADVKRWSTTLDICKSAVIKAVVETSGEDNNMEVLWDLSEPNTSGFVFRMLRWLREATQSPSSRDDLVICAALCLGNLVRRDNNSVALVKPPISVTPHLVYHLKPSSDLKVKHAVTGLLKHLSQSPSNRSTLGEGQVLEGLRTCEIFAQRSDFSEIVQMPAINLAKHLCTNNVNNSIACVLVSDDSYPACLAQVLALSRRSDAVAVKSEGARVLVNVVKSLCSSTGDAHDARRQEATKSVTTLESATVLAQLLGRSKKHTILLNESIMAMMLLALQPGGAIFVLDAIVAPLPREVAPPSRSNTLNMESQGNSNPASPVAGPSTALDMLVTILSDADPTTKFPAELRANLCALVGELGKTSLKTDSAAPGGREREVEKVRTAIRPLLEQAQQDSENMVLGAAARKALEGW